MPACSSPTRYEAQPKSSSRNCLNSTARRYHRAPLCIRKRLRPGCGDLLARVLLVEQPHDEVADCEQEHERLLAVHEDPAEVLVAHRRQAPQPRRMLVERVERTAGEDVREAEERRADEGDGEVAEGRRRAEASGYDQPPDKQARSDEDRVLEVQSPAGRQG